MTDVKKIEKMSDQELRGELHEARAVIEHLQSELKGSVPLKYHDDLMHDWKVSEVAKDKRIAALEAALRGYVKATTGQESATVTFPMALEGEGK